jgi:hypothetical protein
MRIERKPERDERSGKREAGNLPKNIIICILLLID